MSVNIPTVERLQQLSKEGLENYKQEVLNGALCREIVDKIEESALDGYTGWRKTLTSDDDVRALKVIRQALQARGFYCEIEIEHKQGLVGQYKVQKFVVKWGDQK